MCYKTFYHYTDEDSLKKIRASGVIKKSSRKRLLSGSGVYLTTLPPSTMKGFLALNNFDGNSQSENNWVRKMYLEGKVNCYIKLKLKVPHVVKLEKACPRDVWLYQHGDIDLDMLVKPFRVGVVGRQTVRY